MSGRTLTDNDREVIRERHFDDRIYATVTVTLIVILAFIGLGSCAQAAKHAGWSLHGFLIALAVVWLPVSIALSPLVGAWLRGCGDGSHTKVVDHE